MPPLIEGKDLDPDDKAYILKQVADSHQDIYFQDWVGLFYQDKTLKRRILVVTNFRVLTIKVNVLGRSVRQSFPILDLSRMSVTKDSPNKLILEFGAAFATATVQYEGGVTPIVQTILFSYQAITFGRPAAMLPKIELPPELLSSFLPPEPDDQDGLLATYLAECDYNRLEQRLPVLDYLMTCFQLNDRVLDLGECLAFLDKENKTDIQALSSALRFSKWFQEVTAVGYPIKNEGLTSLSSLFTIPTQITKLCLVNVKAGKTGFGVLAKSLGKGVHSLTFLNVSKNNLGDVGLKALTDGLIEGKRVLQTLCLRNCGFSGKGVKPLTSMLELKDWLAGLKILDVSDNRLGKDGTKAMAQWLERPECTVEQLFLVASDLESDVLFEALAANRKLSNMHLKTLNVSGNKMGKKAMSALGAIIEATSSLTQIYLSNAAITRQFFTGTIESALKNKVAGVGFSLDFSNNNLGVKGAKDLDTLFMDWLKRDQKIVTDGGKLHTLILSDNNLDKEGIVTVCKALRGTSLHSLGLDRNVKLGVFSSGVEVGEAFAGLVTHTPHLKELAVAGSDSYALKAALMPLFGALKKNGSLLHLDISQNRLGEPGILALAEAIMDNNTLRSFNVEGNKVTLKALQALHEACGKNKSLVDWVIPMEDIHKILKGASEKRVRELRQMVHELEMYMDRNEASSRIEAKSSPMLVSELDSILRMRGMSRLGAMDDPMLSSNRKTASRLFDSMVQQQHAHGGFPRQSGMDGLAPLAIGGPVLEDKDGEEEGAPPSLMPAPGGPPLSPPSSPGPVKSPSRKPPPRSPVAADDD